MSWQTGCTANDRMVRVQNDSIYDRFGEQGTDVLATIRFGSDDWLGSGCIGSSTFRLVVLGRSV